MKNLSQSHQTISPDKTITQAYFKILKNARKYIATIDDEPLRQILIRSNKRGFKVGSIIHEFLNPLIYIRLEVSDGELCIHYGYEQSDRLTKYYPITSAFIRSIYKYTAKENTEINVEDCVRTDWVITNCAELFEYVGDRNKYHEETIIPYRPRYLKNRLKVA